MNNATGNNGLSRRQLVEALQALNLRRIALLHPPWFSEELNAMGNEYFSDAGFQVLSCARVTPARTFTEVAAKEVHDWIAANTPSEAEGVVIAGNGLRAVGAIHALEATLRRPVITANQALLWKGLRVAGAPAQLEDYGRLFKLGAPA